MKKKIIIGAVVLFGIAVLGVVLFEYLEKPEFGSELSDRSKKFISSQKSGSYSNLLSEEKKDDLKGERVSVGECFSFIMPYSVFNHYEQGKCNEYFAFERPKGSIVAYLTDTVSSSLDQAPGVSMRRLNPEQYEERNIKVGDREFLGFIDLLDQFTITIYHNIDNQYLILTLKLPEENQKVLEGILSSLEFN
ncbi:MAG: hypothetical protein A3A51_00440 [Candidatus Levybacteria bacterium RIFCSPLOWO2_01_FULL_39_10]|nr:MAG: hypothetical protein A3A51_00440 [Candidatus Levybacteria bacterium RIFCSPLOWO2_01_FULL_39_10]